MSLSKVFAVLAFTLFATDAFAVEFFVKATGAVQGAFKGQNAAGQIPLFGYSFQVNTPVDLATGQPSGNREYQPITITKGLDLASAQFLKALISNEALTTVVIQAYSSTKDGKISAAYTITLTNARVVGFNQAADSKDVQSEQVSLSFQSIKVAVADETANDSL